MHGSAITYGIETPLSDTQIVVVALVRPLIFVAEPSRPVKQLRAVAECSPFEAAASPAAQSWLPLPTLLGRGAPRLRRGAPSVGGMGALSGPPISLEAPS